MPLFLQGKWMYEVTLGTAGIMQLGWATAGCQFSNEEGVGDSVDSYAYDGKTSTTLEHQAVSGFDLLSLQHLLSKPPPQRILHQILPLLQI